MNSFCRFVSVAVVAFASLSFCALRASETYPASEAFSETHPFSTTGEITLANANGTVTIRTWDRAEVRIEGEKHAKTAEDLKRIGLSVEASPSRLAIKVELPKQTTGSFIGTMIRAEVQITLTVPATVHLKQIETSSAAIAIDGVRGNVVVHTANGTIRCTGLAADAKLECVNGTIRADFAAITGNSAITVHTVNGSATIGVPKNASFKVQGSAVNGSVSCDFPINVEGASTRTHLSGTVGDGSASLKLDTVNGSVRLTQL